MEKLLPTQWIAKCAVRLSERFKTIDQAMLEEVAMDLWQDPDFRSQDPVEAASGWLKPVDCNGHSSELDGRPNIGSFDE